MHSSTTNNTTTPTSDGQQHDKQNGYPNGGSFPVSDSLWETTTGNQNNAGQTVEDVYKNPSSYPIQTQYGQQFSF